MIDLKIFADGADKDTMLEQSSGTTIDGWTTNPSLLRKAGVKDYEVFAKEVLSVIKTKPISFEVIADDFASMIKQALKIASWGDNVYVKIPIMDTNGVSTSPVIYELNKQGVKLNVTAITLFSQVEPIFNIIPNKENIYFSVFAGRIADTGANYLVTMQKCLSLLSNSGAELIWASTRELYNIVQAKEIGCHIITVTEDILKKLPLIGKNLHQHSIDTVKMFRDDAINSGYTL